MRWATRAALALGATGILAAEAPLLEALERDLATTRIAAVQALGRVGGVAAVPKLRDAAERHASDGNLGRAVRQAVAEIQSRLATVGGARPGQLSLAGGEAGQLSLVDKAVEGRLTLAEPSAEAEEGALHQPQNTGVEKPDAAQGHRRERRDESE